MIENHRFEILNDEDIQHPATAKRRQKSSTKTKLKALGIILASIAILTCLLASPAFKRSVKGHKNVMDDILNVGKLSAKGRFNLFNKHKVKVQIKETFRVGAYDESRELINETHMNDEGEFLLKNIPAHAGFVYLKLSDQKASFKPTWFEMVLNRGQTSREVNLGTLKIVV